MSKLSFSTQYTYNGIVQPNSNNGSTARYEYIEQFDSNGVPYLEVSKEIDIREEINKDAEYYTMGNIIKRFALGEEIPPVTDRNFVDVSDVPTSLIECYNYIRNVENKWNSLSAEEKKVYNNSMLNAIQNDGGFRDASVDASEVKKEVFEKNVTKGDNE